MTKWLTDVIPRGRRINGQAGPLQGFYSVAADHIWVAGWNGYTVGKNVKRSTV